MRKIMATGTIAGALLLGGVAGSTLLSPLLVNAASPTASPSATATPTPSTTPSATTTSSTTAPSTVGDHGRGGRGAGGFGGRNEAVSDTSVAAAAIGISEADLTTALTSGQTIAAVAKAHNVDVQKVIDALVADGQSELAAAVKAGTLTQAQADAQQAEVTQRATAQVNGTFGMGPGH
jgi:hypothetical protein